MGSAGEWDDWRQRPEEKSSGSTASGEGGLERQGGADCTANIDALIFGREESWPKSSASQELAVNASFILKYL